MKRKGRYGKMPRNKEQWARWGMIYLLMFPALLILVVYRYIPMGGGILIAFKDFRITRGILASDWCGWDNFERLFRSPFFGMVLRNTICISLYKLIFGFPAPIILAILLNEVRGRKTKRVLQTGYYLPHFISWVVIANLLNVFFAPNSGALSDIFHALGISYSPLTNKSQFQGFLVLTDIWKEVGWSSIIYLAAITSIDPTLYEAAEIDGANRFQLMRHITFSSLVPTIMMMLMMRVGHILNAGFDQIFVMQNSAVYDVSEILDTYTYRLGFEQGDYATGTVAALFKSVIGLVLVVGVNKFAERMDAEVI